MQPVYIAVYEKTGTGGVLDTRGVFAVERLGFGSQSIEELGAGPALLSLSATTGLGERGLWGAPQLIAQI